MTSVLNVTNESNEVCTDVLFDAFFYLVHAKYAKTNLKGQNMISVTSSSSLDGHLLSGDCTRTG